jgi:sulfur-oxidizing protein SoxZ
MANPIPRVRLPATAKPGELIEIKTLIAHDMESGQRKGADGKVIPQKIIRLFEARFNDKPVFVAEWHPSISANPYQSFFYRAQESGSFAFAWTDEDGSVYRAAAKLTVG